MKTPSMCHTSLWSLFLLLLLLLGDVAVARLWFFSQRVVALAVEPHPETGLATFSEPEARTHTQPLSCVCVCVFLISSVDTVKSGFFFFHWSLV